MRMQNLLNQDPYDFCLMNRPIIGLGGSQAETMAQEKNNLNQIFCPGP